MNARDIIANAGGNLWRMKLRTTLTAAGVLIAIATFVSMLSFGAGLKRNVTEQFDKLGLFSTLHVYPPKTEGVVDSTTIDAKLNQEALRHFTTIPGVNLAYAFDAFGITAQIGDSTIVTKAQSLPEAAVHTRFFSSLRAGRVFAGDSAREAIVSDRFLRQAGIRDVDSALGRPLYVSTKVAVIDSALVHVIVGARERLRGRWSGGWRDSLAEQSFWMDLGRGMASGAMSDFLDGLLNARRTVTDTLTISGVIQGRERTAEILIASRTATRLNSGDFSDDPASLLAMLRSGELLSPQAAADNREYPRVTLDLDPSARYEPIRDSIKALGYQTFSYADEFQEFRKFLLYFNLGLSMVGIIALVTASLGIVNTMVMSILERTREIGVLKSLGADDRDVRLLFLVESSLIGAIGAALGIVVGWLITRAATVVAHHFMAKEGIPLFEPFSFPFWLVGGALLFGVLVSLAAGLYPAARAARIDPVEALRHD